MDCSLPGFSIHGISQASILEWAAISLSRYLPSLGIKLKSPALVDGLITTEPPGKPEVRVSCTQNTERRLMMLQHIASAQDREIGRGGESLWTEEPGGLQSMGLQSRTY